MQKAPSTEHSSSTTTALPVNEAKTERKHAPNSRTQLNRFALRITLALTFASTVLAACTPDKQSDVAGAMPLSPHITSPAPATFVPTIEAAFSPEAPPITVTMPPPVAETAIFAPEPTATVSPPDLAPVNLIEPSPYFIGDSYIMADPLAKIESPEQVASIANATIHRLRALGLTQDNKSDITVTLDRENGKVGCRMDSLHRHLTCYTTDNPFQTLDASLFGVHEPVHAINHMPGNESSTYNIGELRSVMVAFIMSGRNPNIYDRYLFETGFELGGQPVIFSASDIVYGLERAGMSEWDMLRFSLGDHQSMQDIFATAAIGWLSEMHGPESRDAIMAQLQQYSSRQLLDSLTNKRLGINPTGPTYSCFANSVPTTELLAMVSRGECRFAK